MPVAEPGSKPFADKNHPHQQYKWPGKNVCVKRPLIAAKEIRFAILQEVRCKIRRQVAAIVEHNRNRDSDHQHAQQQIQDLPKIIGLGIELFDHKSDFVRRSLAIAIFAL